MESELRPSCVETKQTEELRSYRPRGPWLLEVGSPDGGHARVLAAGDRLVVGSGRNADLRVADSTVSQRHCSIRVTEEHVELEDLGSKNGVYVGSVRVARACLREAAAFVVGRTSVALRAGADESEVNAEPVPGLVGSSLGIRKVWSEVRRHATTRAPVLLQGESGTGKDVVARAIHQLSGRSGAYVPLNVGAVPESLADAELFGARRGAFTGAFQSRVGAFEQAHQGTLFLDEIADLPAALQVKLLRVVEDGCVRALGATQVSRVDVRLISASWACLEERVEASRFRADLFHRLAMVVVVIPPLRQRKADIAELASVWLDRMRSEVGDKRLTSAALARLLEHDWPGNIRELGGVLYRAAMQADTGYILPEHLGLSGKRDVARVGRLDLGQAQELLKSNQGNVSAAARAAGVPR
ncbi:MAG TPA: sigma 54-interacting transcriptional regulator, partial [Polyangiaceae bacterium]|nr:sigma 54-interacting transcriptional regulator [Polyangiaceae bacterium]